MANPKITRMQVLQVVVMAVGVWLGIKVLVGGVFLWLLFSFYY